MRAAGFGAAVWMVVASLQAVFLHVHRGVHAHENSGLLHTHLEKNHQPGVILEAAAEAPEPVWLEWAASAGARPEPPQAALPETAPSLVPEERTGAPPVFVARSHDPPERPAASSRAPPR